MRGHIIAALVFVSGVPCCCREHVSRSVCAARFDPCFRVQFQSACEYNNCVPVDVIACYHCHCAYPVCRLIAVCSDYRVWVFESYVARCRTYQILCATIWRAFQRKNRFARLNGQGSPLAALACLGCVTLCHTIYASLGFSMVVFRQGCTLGLYGL